MCLVALVESNEENTAEKKVFVLISFEMDTVSSSPQSTEQYCCNQASSAMFFIILVLLSLIFVLLDPSLSPSAVIKILKTQAISLDYYQDMISISNNDRMVLFSVTFYFLPTTTQSFK